MKASAEVTNVLQMFKAAIAAGETENLRKSEIQIRSLSSMQCTHPALHAFQCQQIQYLKSHHLFKPEYRSIASNAPIGLS